jgi:hypothetical protein
LIVETKGQMEGKGKVNEWNKYGGKIKRQFFWLYNIDLKVPFFGLLHNIVNFQNLLFLEI